MRASIASFLLAQSYPKVAQDECLKASQGRRQQLQMHSPPCIESLKLDGSNPGDPRFAALLQQVMTPSHQLTTAESQQRGLLAHTIFMFMLTLARVAEVGG